MPTKLVLHRGYWHAVTYDDTGRRIRKSLRTRDRDTAERIIADAQRAPSDGTCGAILDAWLSDAESRLGSPKTAHACVQQLRPYCANLQPEAIDRAWSARYTKARSERGIGPGTIARELGVLRAALRWHDPRTPAVVKVPPSPPPRDRHLTRAEFDRLKAACSHAHLRLFCELALRTGARSGAVLDLTWDRVDLERRRIDLRTVGPKRRKGRAVVPINDSLLAALLDAKRGARSPYVIEWDGGRVGKVLKGFRAAARRAGLDDVTPHVLRHTAAVWMAEEGVSMFEIAQFLGHSDSRVTERVYARFSPDFLRRAAKALE